MSEQIEYNIKIVVFCVTIISGTINHMIVYKLYVRHNQIDVLILKFDIFSFGGYLRLELHEIFSLIVLNFLSNHNCKLMKSVKLKPRDLGAVCTFDKQEGKTTLNIMKGNCKEY